MSLVWDNRSVMKIIMAFWSLIRRFFIAVWDFIFFFFGMPYEEQAKKLGDYDARGEDNPKRKYTAYRANKVAKD